MTWFAAGSAALTVGANYFTGSAANRNAVRNANATSRAEGEAITKERLNYTIRNSYATAQGQYNLAQQKRALNQQSADISQARLQALGDAELSAASTGSMGASINAMAADIEQKAQAAQDVTAQSYQDAQEAYNYELQMMVLNTQATNNATVTKYEGGQSSSSLMGMSLLSGLTTFAGNYATQRMQLGLGQKAQQAATVTSNTSQYGLSGTGTIGFTGTGRTGFRF